MAFARRNRDYRYTMPKKAVRTAIVAINIIDFFLSLAMWGTSTTVRLGG